MLMQLRFVFPWSHYAKPLGWIITEVTQVTYIGWKPAFRDAYLHSLSCTCHLWSLTF